LHNYRSDFNFRGTRIIVTGSILGRYEKDGKLPLVKEAYNIFKDSMVDTLRNKIDTL